MQEFGKVQAQKETDAAPWDFIIFIIIIMIKLVDLGSMGKWSHLYNNSIYSS